MMLSVLFSIFAWMITALFFTLHMILSWLASFFVQDSEHTSLRLTRPFIRTGYWLLRFRVEIHGNNHIPKEGPFIVVSNHQSHLDILTYLLGKGDDSVWGSH
ncbi:hypothetical protein EBR96_05365 [bacterium]|nr:hypothetical protein [bacterium]